MVRIQKDYLSIMDRYIFHIAIFSSIFAMVGMAVGGTAASFGGLLFSISFIYPPIFLFLIVKSIRRSFIFNHIANVVFTDKFLVFGQEIIALNAL